MANMVITIARQYGASGRFTGEILSELMGIPCYDRELITMSAAKSGYNEDVVESYDEKAQSSLLYTLAVGSVDYGTPVPLAYHMPMSDKLYIMQSNIIRELADKSPCIIVGRCADHVLNEHEKRVAVFLKAELSVRAERVAERHNISLSEAQDMCVKTDRRRASYYSHYTGQKWGRSDLYDLMIDTTRITARSAALVIKQYVESIG